MRRGRSQYVCVVNGRLRHEGVGAVPDGAAEQVDAVLPAGTSIAELVCDKGLPQQPDAGHIGRGGHPQLRVGLEFRIRSLNRGLGHHCVAPEF